MATTGCRPPIASPAADVIACCSAMPTSKKRSGNRCAERRQPGRTRHGGGDRHDVAALGAVVDQRLGRKPTSSPGRARDVASPVSGSMTPHACIWSASSFSAGAIAHALAGDDVHDHRRVEAAGVTQRALHGVLVVAVDGADVLQAEVGEHHLRRERVLDTGLDAVQRTGSRARRDRRTPRSALRALVQEPSRSPAAGAARRDARRSRRWSGRSCGRCR